MKQEEKQQHSRERILNAAIEEFGTKGYDGASLSGFLQENKLSKGLVYHYFENKDQLYLACVKHCLDQLTQALSTVGSSGSAEVMMQAYFSVRGNFLLARPYLGRIFFDALLQPPVHLRAQLEEVRADFDLVNRSLFQTVLSGLRLRDGVSEADAMSYFTLMQSALHLRFLSTVSQGSTAVVPMLYEEQARKTLELLLFGLTGKGALE